MGLTTGSFPPVELVLFALGGVLVATLTSGVDPFDPSAWWDEPLVYQKLVVYLCSAATPPGAGAHRMWGYNVATSALGRVDPRGRSGAPAAETQSAGGW